MSKHLKNNKILVSIIIPFYNRISKLLKSIDSVKNQTYFNWELILVDDCSTDNITEILDECNNDKRIKIIRLNKNSGPAKARNVGLKQAIGKYVAFLDSDDEFLPKKIEKQLNIMENSNAEISHTSYMRFDGKSKKAINSGILNGKTIPRIIRSCNIATPTIMLNRKFIIENNLFFPENIRIGEDICYWIKISKKTDIVGINEPLTIVNVNSKSSYNDFKKQLEGISNILKFVLNDDELSIYYDEISNLCFAYYNLSNLVNQKNIKSKISFRQLIRKIVPFSIRKKIRKILRG